MDKKAKIQAITFIVNRVFVPQILIVLKEAEQEFSKDFEWAFVMSGITKVPIVPKVTILDIQKPSEDLLTNLVGLMEAENNNIYPTL